jgi:hypothetical protein
MDQERFDRVVRILARGGMSRRRVLQALMAGAGGGALLAGARHPVLAAGKCEAKAYRACCTSPVRRADCTGPNGVEGREACRQQAVTACPS